MKASISNHVLILILFSAIQTTFSFPVESLLQNKSFPIKECQSNSNNFPQFTAISQKKPFYELIELVSDQLDKIWSNESIASSLSENCLNNLTHIFVVNATSEPWNISKYFVQKLFSDSSKNKNDATTFGECKYKKYNFKDTNFINDIKYLLTIINTNKNKIHRIQNWTYENNYYLFGICGPSYCNDTEYRSLVFQAINSTNGFLGRDVDKIDYIEVMDIPFNLHDVIMKSPNKDIIRIIICLTPLLISLMFAIAISLNWIPFCLFKYCFKNKNFKGRKSSWNEEINRSKGWIPGGEYKNENKNDEDNSADNIKNDDNSISNDWSSSSSWLNILPNFTNPNNIKVSTWDNSEEKNTHKWKAKNNRGNWIKNTNTVNNKYNKSKFQHFRGSWKLVINGEEWFNYYLISSEINNESGWIYIKGVRGLCMIFLLFGTVFFDLFNSPVAIYGEENFANLNTSYVFFLFFFGLRYAPRILLSCSGYFLFYKLICFLDECKENEIERQLSKQAESQSIKNNISPIKHNDDDNTSDEDSIRDELQKHCSIKTRALQANVRFSHWFRFYFYQSHKYLLFIGILLIMQYSWYYLGIIIFGFQTRPIWEYFNRKVWNQDHPKMIELLLGFSGLYPFNILSNEDHSIFKYFWWVYNEIIFFVVTSFVIFIGYKYKLRINSFLLWLILIFFVSKVMLFILKLDKLQEYSNIQHTALYYYTYDFGKIFVFPGYNYIYYIIGVFFGSMNYVVQKGIDYSIIIDEQKYYLAVSVKWVNWCKKNQNFSSTFSPSNPLNIANLIYPMFKAVTTRELLEKWLNSYWVNLWWLIDTDLVILVFQMVSFIFYIKGDNFINSVLSHQCWLILNKFYFSYICVINPVIWYVLYQSETRINLNYLNCILYSLICGFLCFFVTSIIYIIYELSWKRIIKMFAQAYDKNKDSEECLPFNTEEKTE